MRLLDRILSSGFAHYLDNYLSLKVEDKKGFLREIFGGLDDAQLVVIDNVARYYAEQRLEDFFTASDFPCVMLPFEVAFLEFRFPAKTRMLTGCEEVGVLFMMQDPKERDEEYPEALQRLDVKYHLVGYCFVRPVGQQKTSLFSEYLLPIGAGGQIISPNEEGRIHGATILYLPGLSEEEEQRNLRFVHQFVNFPTFLALSFMHCRNVQVREEIPPPRLSKAHQRRKGRPLLRYHVLEIDHMKSVLEREGHAGTTGLKKALHICRGHFATYGADGKGLLFGKHAGRYWIPMHTRGSVQEGMVVKDYAVN